MGEVNHLLQITFENLCSAYTADKSRVTSLWAEVEKRYNAKGRYYHNLVHLENLLAQLSVVQAHIKDWNTLLFSLFYHDIIYEVLKSDNEEKSAALAVARMGELSLPESSAERCRHQILATKKHQNDSDSDTNYFTDADLSVLGQEWDIYWEYAQNVRKEYAIYPDLLYKPGRKKVLKHFLDKPRIYHTPHFFEKYEEQAKANLEAEWRILMKY
jgi:predicted metal-dependent HD superfamily phosphohydrolase